MTLEDDILLNKLKSCRPEIFERSGIVSDNNSEGFQTEQSNQSNHWNIDTLLVKLSRRQGQSSLKHLIGLLHPHPRSGSQIRFDNNQLVPRWRTVIAMTRGPDPILAHEFMPVEVRWGMHLLFSHASSRELAELKLLKAFQDWSVREGHKFDSPHQAQSQIRHFVKKYRINVSASELLQPELESYTTFNDFFHRRLNPLARPLASPTRQDIISSPADCRMVVYDNVTTAQQFWIKGQHFTLETLLQSSTHAEYFKGANLMIARLAPGDYHRFHSPVNAFVRENVKVLGTYLTVNPLVVNNKNFDVFTSNKRLVTYLELDRPSSSNAAGGEYIAYVQIGALLVGSIKPTVRRGQRVKRGDEVGYFAYGGSTIVVLFRKGSVEFDQDLVRNSLRSIETVVKVKDRVAKFVCAVDDNMSATTSNTGPVPPRQTDVRRRTVLPKTLQNMQAAAASRGGNRGAGEGSSGADDVLAVLELPSEEYLDKIEEELNRRVDQDTETLVEGMAELIDGKDHYRVAQDSFQANVRTESMIRAAHSLISLSHTLKLLHLFADTKTPLEARQRLAQQYDTDIEAAKTRIRNLVNGTD
ncbi:hypothetical protein OIO90_002555 [Microbotryomycetes sp. JL221]|nr:hypothetical protein OIO90_002555 [Microbotryomycetes sp. JL221]